MAIAGTAIASSAVAGTLAYPRPSGVETECDPGEGMQVLLVEDNSADAYLIQRALSRNSRVSSVKHVIDGVQALRTLDEGGIRPDLAIIDLQMPRMDGFKLLVELGCRVPYQFPKIVLTSSFARGDFVRSRLRGAGRVFTKPDTLEDLEVLLNHAVAGAYHYH